MKLQYLCHLPLSLLMGVATTCVAADATGGGTPTHDYPTVARVEYVNQCIAKNDGKLAALYQCSCALDRIASALTYDDFVEQSTYAKYATLPGEGGGIFRDSAEAKKLAKNFRDLEADALKSCGASH
jgi:hypothetical protein